MIHVQVFNIDLLTIEDLDTLSTVLYQFTVVIQYNSVQLLYRSNIVESNHDTTLYVVTLESIQYLH